MEAFKADKGSTELFDKGNQLYAEGRFDEAIAIFEEFLAKYPDIYQAHINLGSNYLKKEDLDKAQSEFQLVLDKTLQIHGTYQKDSKPRSAHFRAWARPPSRGTISKLPRSISSRPSRSPRWTRPRPTTSARSSSPTRRSTRRSPISSWRSRSRRTGRKPYNRLGMVYLNKGDFPKALEYFQRVHRHGPGESGGPQRQGHDLRDRKNQEMKGGRPFPKNPSGAAGPEPFASRHRRHGGIP